jgi:hypothetical protein
VTGEVGHLPSRHPCRHLDDSHVSVLARDQLREGDAVAQAERADGVQRHPLRLRQHVPLERRRVDVDPADAEADPGRA